VLIRGVAAFIFFRFWDICLCMMKYLGMGSEPKQKNLCLNKKFIYVSYIPYTYSLKFVLCNSLHNFVQEMKFCSVEFSTCGITSAPKKLWILEHFTGLGVLNHLLQRIQLRNSQVEEALKAVSRCTALLTLPPTWTPLNPIL
jgi:hypothetical protein